MASLPYPLNRLYTHIVSVIATTQSACILMSVWVWQGCHTLLQIPILLFFKNLFFCSSVFSNNNMFSCPHVFKTKTCSHVLLSFKKTCSSVFPQQHVLMFFCLFKQQHVLMFSCLQNNNMFSCSLVFQKNMFFCLSPKRTMFSVQSCLYVAKKKRLRATLPAVKP